MLAPAVQYGDWAIVSKRMRRIVTRITRGEGIVAVMSEDGMLDVGEHAGRIIVGGRVLAGGTDFHCFMPWRTLWQKLLDDPGLMEAIFRESLSVSWGVLGLLAMDNTPWFYVNEERYEPFLEAALRVWDELDAVGSRYYIALQAQSLWSIPNSLHYPREHGCAARPPACAVAPRGAARVAQVRTHRELKPEFDEKLAFEASSRIASGSFRGVARRRAAKNVGTRQIPVPLTSHAYGRYR